MEQHPPLTNPHFLVITFPAQGHLNPALHLAKRLASSTNADITFSTATLAHRRMFPSLSSPIHRNGITYMPFSDGFCSSSSSLNDNPEGADLRSSLLQIKQFGSKHLYSILQGFAAVGRPVTFVIYTIMLQWAADVATELGIPSALYWIQAATVLSIYHHFFNGYESLIAPHVKDPSFTISFPALPSFRICDLPTFVTITSPEDPFSDILDDIRNVFDNLSLRRETWGKPRVIVNSFDELERKVLVSLEENMELITVGPVVHEEEEGETGDMFEQDEKEYMEWLDSQEDKSVVYVAFGSLVKMNKEELEEIAKGLMESHRPYLWVVRKDSRWKDVNFDGDMKKGMVVEWCKQRRVLNHKAVGCFVTHCGWNSTMEGLLFGVPTVAMPTWSDQVTNAWLMEREWGTAVKAEVGDNGRLGSEELMRCLEIVMGEGERGVEIRKKAEMWKEKARKAIGEGGSSGKNLKALVAEQTTTEISKIVQILRWDLPHFNFFKLNTDGAFNPSSAACGGVIRDHFGNLVLLYNAKISPRSAITSEIFGAFIGITICKFMSLKNIILETDSAPLLQILKGLSQGKASDYKLIQHTLIACQSLQLQLQHCFREANQVAHCITQLAETWDVHIYNSASFSAKLNGLIRLESLGIPYLRFKKIKSTSSDVFKPP